MSLSKPSSSGKGHKLIKTTCTPLDEKKPWHETMDFLQPPLQGDEFKLSSYQSHVPIGMAETIMKGEHVLFSIDFETLCKQTVWSNVGKRHPVPCEYGQSVLDMRQIKNGVRQQRAPAEAANAAAGCTLVAISDTEAFTFTPCLDNPGDRGHNWTRRAKTDHLIVDEFTDHYGHNCKEGWHSGAHRKSKFIAWEDLGQIIQAR
ncbi:hypothetical protein LX32DRAFT_658253 [Colletotrichum zoysiae]|uniref:Uncharacterized protein n=1 Tax=Colletotrichum zoysiae TaxID=1216348 RepID=A0AAD9H5H8_9PEZI|nr:hypothetical protein LX32DRAFT_658253 [Colletotrichum zoysiae]